MSGDTLIARCSVCGKPKPNDASWARAAEPCCVGAVWTASVTFTDTPEGPVAHGDIRYELDPADAAAPTVAAAEDWIIWLSDQNGLGDVTLPDEAAARLASDLAALVARADAAEAQVMIHVAERDLWRQHAERAEAKTQRLEVALRDLLRVAEYATAAPEKWLEITRAWAVLALGGGGAE